MRVERDTRSFAHPLMARIALEVGSDSEVCIHGLSEMLRIDESRMVIGSDVSVFADEV